MFRRYAFVLASTLVGLLVLASGCASPTSSSATPGKKTVVVTYSILGAVVQDLESIRKFVWS